jgi:hypothetical protein
MNSGMNERLIITPKTKVLQLIEAYPELEDVLIGFVPAFKKLKNPVLRKTVAKVATLQQAAAIGNLKVEELINYLRKKAGQEMISDEAGSQYNMKKPSWFSPELVKKSLDAREMLSRGEYPVAQVMEDLKTLEKGSVYCLSAPFLPAPLIDKATSLGAQHWVIKEGDDAFLIYFC